MAVPTKELVGDYRVQAQGESEELLHVSILVFLCLNLSCDHTKAIPMKTSSMPSCRFMAART